ncbi:MAG: hypothetical protein ACFB3T_11655 [Geminicoccaceae bacterium]
MVYWVVARPPGIAPAMGPIEVAGQTKHGPYENVTRAEEVRRRLEHQPPGQVNAHPSSVKYMIVRDYV